MPAKLYVVHGSHPCEAVKRALEMKGIDYKIVEIPPPFQVVVQKLLLGQRTVPGIKFDDGEKVIGSTPIMRRLDEKVAEPKLFGDERVGEAEAWGESVLQPMARRLQWRAFKFRPDTMHGFQEGGRLPPLPKPVIRVMAPGVLRAEFKMNGVGDEAVRADLAALPGHLDHVDSLIADGVIGGAVPNAADLQIASSLRLMLTLGDVRTLADGHPAADLAFRLFPNQAGDAPAGTFPAAWVPQSSASSSASLAG